MQGEFEALGQGQLAWAIGCLAAASGWRLREEWLYLLLLCAVPVVIYWANQLPFDLLWYGLVSRHTFEAFERSYGATAGMLEPLPLAIALGAYRPRKMVMTVILGCLLAQHVVGTLMAMRVGGTFLSWWAPNATLYMAPPMVGLAASICVWFLGTSLGVWTRRGRARA